MTNYTAVLTAEDCVCFGLVIVHFMSRSLSNHNAGYQADYHCVNIALPLETSKTYHARLKWLLINLRNTGRIYVSGSLEPVTRTILTLGYLFQSYTRVKIKFISTSIQTYNMWRKNLINYNKIIINKMAKSLILGQFEFIPILPSLIYENNASI